MMKQSVDQRMLFIARRRVDHQAGRLVQDQQCFIFEKNLQRQFLGLSLRRARFGPMHRNLFACPGGVGGFDRLAIHQDVTFFDQALNGAAGNRRKFAAQKSIQPFRRQRTFDSQNFSPRRHKPVRHRELI
jgi:hypothetical protein